MFPAAFNFNRPLIASANIRPGRCLALSNSAESTVAEATGVTLPLVGISKNRYKYAYGGYEQTAVPYLAETGDAVDYYGPGQIGEAVCGAAITNLARPLTSDGSGRVISTAALGNTTNNWIVGFPLDTAAAADEVVRVVVVQSMPVLV